jgi:hypothetical protein
MSGRDDEVDLVDAGGSKLPVRIGRCGGQVAEKGITDEKQTVRQRLRGKWLIISSAGANSVWFPCWGTSPHAAGAKVVIDPAPRSGASVDTHGHTVKTGVTTPLRTVQPPAAQTGTVATAARRLRLDRWLDHWL